MRLLTARGLADLEEAVSDSAKQGLWLRDRKVGSQVIGEDRNRFAGRGTVEEVRRGKREYTDLGLDLGKREEQVTCHASAVALAMTDKALREAEM